MQIDSEYKPSESDIKTVMEAHGLLPEGPLLDEALGLASLYADLIQKRLGEVPDLVNREKAVLAIIEEGLMREGIIRKRQEKKSEMPAEKDKSDKDK
jgi:hypothetical protein